MAEGVFRGYSINTEGTEIPDCIVAGAGYAIMPDFYTLLSQYPAIGELHQRAMQKAGQYYIRKARIMSGYSARKRYQWFLKTYPGIANRLNRLCVQLFLRMNKEITAPSQPPDFSNNKGGRQ